MTALGPKGVESTGFLYPFIDAEETDATSLLDDLAASARGKAGESARLQQESLDEYEPVLIAAGIGPIPAARAAIGSWGDPTR